MEHDTFTEKISLWLDEELSAPEVAELEAHLAGCPACQQTHQTMQRVDTLLHSGSKVLIAPAPGFVQRFETRLAQQQTREQGHVWLGLGVLLLGTICLFILGGVILYPFVSAGVNMIGLSALFVWLAEFIESANAVGLWLRLVGLFLKASFITMSQPLFWLGVLGAVGVAWLWLRLLKLAYRRIPTTIELFI